MIHRLTRPLLRSAPLTLIWAVGDPSYAQAPEPIETVVVSGTRLPRALDDTGSVTIIEADEIAARNNASAFDLLRDVPGVHVSHPGGRGAVGSVFIRSSEPNYGAVLIDGVQANDPTNTRGGSFDFSMLDIDSIERIEVLRAPQSSIYGSDALSGVINVVTHSGSQTATIGGDVELGTAEYARAGVRLGGPAGRGQYGFQLGGLRDGDASDDPSSLTSRFVSGKFATDPDADSALSLSARYASTDAVSFPDDSGGDRLAVIRERERRKTQESSIGLQWSRPLAQHTALHVRTSWFEHLEETDSPGVALGVRAGIPANVSDNDFSRVELDVYSSSTLRDSIGLVVGLGYDDEDGRGESLIFLSPQFALPANYELARDNLGGYVEIDYGATSRIHIDAALRIDKPENHSSVDSGKLTLSYAFSEHATRLHLTWAQGFKLPSLFALGNPLVGNPELASETSTSTELGLSSQLGDIHLYAAAFDQNFENLIDFDADSFTTVNRSNVDIRGIEFDARYAITPEWTLSGHGTFTDVEVRDEAVELRQRPEKTGGLRIRWQPAPSWEVQAGWHYVGERFDSSVPTGGRVLPSYETLDLALNRQLTSGVALSLAVDNVTDEDFESAIGFSPIGRRVRLSVRGSLQIADRR